MESSAQRLINLANQWEKHRAPLIDQYRELKGLNSEKEVCNSWYYDSRPLNGATSLATHMVVDDVHV